MRKSTVFFNVFIFVSCLAVIMLVSNTVAYAAGGGGDGGEGEVSHEESAGSDFVEIDPLMLPIVGVDGVSQSVNIVIIVQVKNRWKANKVTDLEPRLKSAYIEEMYGTLSATDLMTNGVLQVGELRKRLLDITIEVLGDDVVQDILFKTVDQRPI